MNYLTVKDISEKWGVTERRVTLLCREGRINGAKKSGKTWLIPDNSLLPADGRTKEAANSPARVPVPSELLKNGKRAATAFEEIYYKKPKDIVFTPYRICPIGAHSDHQLGKITGFAIDKGVYMAYDVKKNSIIEIKSLQFKKRAQWYIKDAYASRENDWADHLRGAAVALDKRYSLRMGLSAIVDGELPIGGLSSSAAVILTFLTALSQVNGIKLTAAEMIDIAQEAENNYVGVACGKLDQSCEVYSRKDKLLYLDTLDGSYELIQAPKNMKPYEFVIFFSGLERTLTLSNFNTRVDECRSAAYALKAFSGMEYGSFSETNLREVPYEIYEKYKMQLPENWRKRAEHWYSEYKRVEDGAKAWKSGDIEKFGKLSFQSGRSSIDNWETGSPELIKLYEIMTETKGIYGGRFSGAGFKGCCMALIDPKYEESILNRVETEYLKAFPEMRGKYSAYICHTANGVG